MRGGRKQQVHSGSLLLLELAVVVVVVAVAVTCWDLYMKGNMSWTLLTLSLCTEAMLASAVKILVRSCRVVG